MADTDEPCQHFRVWIGPALGPACPDHLTDEERAAWQDIPLRERYPGARICFFPEPDDPDLPDFLR